MAIGWKRAAESQNRMDDSLKELISRSQAPRCSVGDVYECSARSNPLCRDYHAGETDPGRSVLVDINDVLTKLEAKFRKSLGRAAPWR